MTDWRIYGFLTAKRRSTYGLHMALYGKRITFNGFYGRDKPCLLVLCSEAVLADALEAQLRLDDWVHIAGVTQPRTRPQTPLLVRDWDMIVTEARVPRFTNFCRRLLIPPPPDVAVEEDNDDQSSP